MEGRRRVYTREITGRTGGRAARSLNTKLVHASPKIAAEVVFQIMASTSPAVNALYVAYKLAKFVKPIIDEGVKEYETSGDSNRVTEKMVQETVKQTGKEIVNKSIGVIVDTVYTETVQNFGLETSEVVDTVVTSVASKVIEEIVVGD
jgi:hypothetical protein